MLRLKHKIKQKLESRKNNHMYMTRDVSLSVHGSYERRSSKLSDEKRLQLFIAQFKPLAARLPDLAIASEFERLHCSQNEFDKKKR